MKISSVSKKVLCLTSLQPDLRFCNPSANSTSSWSVMGAAGCHGCHPSAGRVVAAPSVTHLRAQRTPDVEVNQGHACRGCTPRTAIAHNRRKPWQTPG